jgi:predicted phage tail protein
MITISLYGGLEKWFGEAVRLDVCSPQEAIWALAAQCEDFLQHIFISAEEGVGYRVVVDGQEIDPSGLELPVIKTISITPAVAGSGVVGRIILGAVLLVGSFFLPVAVLGISSLAIGQAGVALILGGVSSLLTTKPTDQKSQNSFVLDANGQPRSYQGDAKPILFGFWWIENPPVISLWLDTENIPVDWQVP